MDARLHLRMNALTRVRSVCARARVSERARDRARVRARASCMRTHARMHALTCAHILRADTHVLGAYAHIICTPLRVHAHMGTHRPAHKHARTIVHAHTTVHAHTAHFPSSQSEHLLKGRPHHTSCRSLQLVHDSCQQSVALRRAAALVSWRPWTLATSRRTQRSMDGMIVISSIH
eukprot:2702736-Pleurochrysis_carterae.AAC.1